MREQLIKIALECEWRVRHKPDFLAKRDKSRAEFRAQQIVFELQALYFRLRQIHIYFRDFRFFQARLRNVQKFLIHSLDLISRGDLLPQNQRGQEILLHFADEKPLAIADLHQCLRDIHARNSLRLRQASGDGKRLSEPARICPLLLVAERPLRVAGEFKFWIGPEPRLN